MKVLYASCRDNFSNVFVPSKCNLYHDADGDDIPESVFCGSVANARVLILVHGYRSETGGPYYTKVLRGINQWGIAPHYDVIVGYLWPGGFFRGDYPISVLRAHTCAPRLTDLTCLLMAHNCIVDVQTHSLGAHVAMDALQSHKAEWRHLFLLAPAIDNESIESDQPFGKAVERQIKSTFAFYSANDGVLKEAFPIGESACGNFCATALGLSGAADPKKLPPNAKQVDCSAFIHDHSEYRISAQFHAEWQKCFGSGE